MQNSTAIKIDANKLDMFTFDKTEKNIVFINVEIKKNWESSWKLINEIKKYK